MKNVGIATCDQCGQEKECIQISILVESFFFTKTKTYNLCETCLSKALRMCKREQ